MVATAGTGDGVFLNQKLADASLVKALVGHLDVGVCVVDADLNVVAINDLARRTMGFPADLVRSGLTLEVLIRFNAARGDFGEGNVDDIVRERLAEARTTRAGSFAFTQEDGSQVYVKRSLLPDGGFITTYSGNPVVRRDENKVIEPADAGKGAKVVETDAAQPDVVDAGVVQPTISNQIVTPLDQSGCRPEQQHTASDLAQELAEVVEMPAGEPQSGEVAKILIAEDNATNQEVFLELLEDDAYEVTSVTDGREAVVQYIANRAKFDIIVMDLTMPNMGGVAATQAIRAHEKVSEVPRIPIIGVSAFATDEHREQAQAAGMDEYLTKPIDVEHFLECLARLAGDRQVQSLKGKAQEMAFVSGMSAEAAPLSIADLARKYQTS